LAIAPSVRPIADAVPFGIVCSCAARIPIEPGRWPQRSRPEAVGGDSGQSRDGPSWHNLSKLELARRQCPDDERDLQSGQAAAERCRSAEAAVAALVPGVGELQLRALAALVASLLRQSHCG